MFFLPASFSSEQGSHFVDNSGRLRETSFWPKQPLTGRFFKRLREAGNGRNAAVLNFTADNQPESLAVSDFKTEFKSGLKDIFFRKNGR